MNINSGQLHTYKALFSVRRVQTTSLIDATDELLEKIINNKPHEKRFRECYEDLCDFCHPNFNGTSGGSSIIHEERSVIFHNTNYISDADFVFFFYINIFAFLFLYFYKDVLKMIKGKEIMPIFHKI